jgi:hypothetical protein
MLILSRRKCETICDVIRDTYNDVKGKEVTIVDRGFKTAGRHTVTLNAATFTSGVYFYQLNAGAYEAVRKLVIMK